MIKAVLFDFDGTMFDTEVIWTKYFFKANKKFKLDFDEAFRQTLVGKGEEQTRIDVKKIKPKLNVVKYREWIINKFTNQIKKYGAEPKLGLYELIDYLQNNNYKMAIVSGNQLDRLDTILTKSPLKSIIFDAIITNNPNIPSKPNPDPFLVAAKRIGVMPSECLVLEDGYNGIRAGYTAGCKTIMIPDTLPPTEEMKQKSTILNNLLEVIDYLKADRNQPSKIKTKLAKTKKLPF